MADSQTVIERAARSRSTRRWYGSVLLITLGQLTLRGWAAGGGWFYWDDYWWHDIVARTPLFEASLLSFGGHFSPLTYAPYWLVTAAAPYEWSVRVVVMLLTLAAIDVAVLLIARRLWRSPGPQLTVYLLWCFSSLAAPSWLWFSQFGMMGALLLGSTWSLWAYIKATQTARPRDHLVAVSILTVALLAQERMIVSAVLVVLVAVFIVDRAASPLGVVTRNRPLFVATALVCFSYTLVYLRVADEVPGSVPVAANDVLAVAVKTALRSALPGLAGGPWLLDDTPVLGRSGTPPWLQLFTVVLLVSVMTWSIRRDPWSLRPWLILGLGVLVNAGLVGFGRGATLAEFAPSEWRYFSDLAVLAPVLMVAAFVPPGTDPRFTAVGIRTAQALVALTLVGGVTTTVVLGMRWHQSPSRQFVAAAINQFAERPDAVVIDRVLPDEVVNPALGLQRLASRVFSIVEPAPRFDEPTSHPLWLTDEGFLVPAVFMATANLPEAAGCVHPVDGTNDVQLSVPGEDVADNWGVRLQYEATRATDWIISDGARRTRVRLEQGSRTVYIPIFGVGRDLTLFMANPESDGCVRSIAVGRFQPQ